MNRLRVTPQALGISFLCITTTAVHAGIPVWSFSPNGSTKISVSATGTATASYTVTNNSTKPHQLALSSQTPAGISLLGGPCILAGKSAANPNPSCTITLNINGSALPANNISGGPVLCQIQTNHLHHAPNQCYQPNPGDILSITRTSIPGATTLSTSIVPPSILALSVNDSLNPALTGTARNITITNTGINEATGLNIAYPTWPGGTPATTASSTCGTSLAAGATCTITITPGSSPSSNCNTGIAPTPGTITVSATNVATAVTSNVVVLSYGCQYQGGFLYSVDDTTPNTGSIGGKVTSLVDQANPLISQAGSVIWSSNGSGSISSNVSRDIIPLISEIPTANDSYANAEALFNTTYANESTYPFPASSAFATCNGASDGQCNSNNILTLYETYQTGFNIGAPPFTLSPGPTNPTYYAAGLCTTTINTYSDWYLPAICELDSVFGTVTCPAGSQSIVANLSFLIGDPNSPPSTTSCNPPSGTECFAGGYWSSTERASTPQLTAWSEFFNSSGVTQQGALAKNTQIGARCSRALTL